MPLSFQEIILKLHAYWSAQGCLVVFPYDTEKGAGTLNPHTFLRALGPEPWRAAYVEPSRRPNDGRYGDNPFRLQHYYQYQCVIKPAPPNAQALYEGSLQALGIDARQHDLRYVEDDWEQATFGCAGLGWEGEEFDDLDLVLCRSWLRSKGNSIEGGTSEVQLNIIAKRVLGLPD